MIFTIYLSFSVNLLCNISETSGIYSIKINTKCERRKPENGTGGMAQVVDFKPQDH
jgi:hypothetical protein